MKKYGKYLIFSILVLLSFYTTNKTASLVRDQDPILKEIKTASIERKTDYVNATVTDDYIIPGMYGSIHDGFDRMVVVSVDRLIEWLRCSQKEKRLRDYIAGRRITVSF